MTGPSAAWLRSGGDDISLAADAEGVVFVISIPVDDPGAWSAVSS